MIIIKSEQKRYTYCLFTTSEKYEAIQTMKYVIFNRMFIIIPYQIFERKIGMKLCQDDV